MAVARRLPNDDDLYFVDRPPASSGIQPNAIGPPVTLANQPFIPIPATSSPVRHDVSYFVNMICSNFLRLI